MPSNVVKTDKDEEKWEKAKEKAKEQGHGSDHAYIMSIYKNMCPAGIDDEKLPDHCKSSSKKGTVMSLKDDLIKLGNKVPELRKHLFHVISNLEKISKLKKKSLKKMKRAPSIQTTNPSRKYLWDNKKEDPGSKPEKIEVFIQQDVEYMRATWSNGEEMWFKGTTRELFEQLGIQDHIRKGDYFEMM